MHVWSDWYTCNLIDDHEGVRTKECAVFYQTSLPEGVGRLVTRLISPYKLTQYIVI